MRFIVSTFLAVQASVAEMLTLTDNNFDRNLNVNPIMLVAFHAPWDGNSKKALTVLSNASEELEAQDVSATIATVDAEKEKEVAARHGVTKYPKLLLFKDGKSQEWNGGHTKMDKIVKLLKAASGPAVADFKTEADVNDFTSEHDLALVGIFADPDFGGEAHKHFLELCKKNAETHKCAIFNARKAFGYMSSHGLSTLPGLVRFNKDGTGDDKKMVLENDFEMKSMKRFFAGQKKKEKVEGEEGGEDDDDEDSAKTKAEMKKMEKRIAELEEQLREKEDEVKTLKANNLKLLDDLEKAEGDDDEE